MFIADAHCDTLYSIGVNQLAPEACAITAERMRAAGVGLQTFAMFAGSKGPAGAPYEAGKQMLSAIDRLGVTIYRHRLPDAPPSAPAGVISIEGGEMVKGSIELLDEFYQAAGIRMMALTWNNENEIGHPAKYGSAEGLKPFGLRLLKEMDARGIYADVSHLNEAGFWDIAEHASLPPIASHSNMRSLCNHTRNLTNEQIRAIIEKQGYIGINFYSYFLREDGQATLEDVFRHIDGIAQMGGISVLGFGSDFDGIEAWPEGLAHPGDYPNLIDLMRRHGYAERDIEAIAGGNLWRLLKRADALRTA